MTIDMLAVAKRSLRRSLRDGAPEVNGRFGGALSTLIVEEVGFMRVIAPRNLRSAGHGVFVYHAAYRRALLAPTIARQDRDLECASHGTHIARQPAFSTPSGVMKPV
jgi:hypothetical protein